MKQLNIVLVEPQIPQNTGNIARTCAATGARLHLVGPMGFAIEDKKLKRPFFYFSPQARRRYCDVADPDGAYLVFGREDAGLPEALLYANEETCVRLPMRQAARSLNLSNSVAVGVYEALRQHGFPDLLCEGRLRNYDWGKMV